MTTKQNAIDLARTARSEAANTAKRTMAEIIANWNECVKQAGFFGVYDFPTSGYTRKSQIIADLERCAAQLDDYAAHRELIEQAHDEALEMDEAINIAVRVIKAMAGHDIEEVLAGVRGGLYRNGVSDVYATAETALRIAVAESHAEALEINEAIDDGLAVLCQDNQCLFDLLNGHSKRLLVEACHAEALKLDASRI